MAKHSYLKTLPLAFVVLGIISVTFYSLRFGRFSKLGIIDTVCLILGLIVVAIWQLTGDPITANLILQVVYVISFIPTIIGLSKGSLFESSTPWVFAVLSYLLMIIVTISHWEQSSWVELAHPVLNGVIGNGVVAYYALVREFKFKTNLCEV
jgi:hypothetical protein